MRVGEGGRGARTCAANCAELLQNCCSRRTWRTSSGAAPGAATRWRMPFAVVATVVVYAAASKMGLGSIAVVASRAREAIVVLAPAEAGGADHGTPWPPGVV